MGESGGGSHGGGSGGFDGGSYGGGFDYYSSDYDGDCDCSSNGSPNSEKCFRVVFPCIVAVCFALFTCTAIVLTFKNSVLASYVISPQEQICWCGKKEISLKRSSSDIKVYETVDGFPDLSDEIRYTEVQMSDTLKSGSYRYRSFFLPKGSTLVINKTIDFSATLIIIEGKENMNSFMNDEIYSYLYKYRLYWPNNSFSFMSSEFGQYYVVIDAVYETYFSIDISVTLTTFNTSNLTEQCTSQSSTCKLNKRKNENYCIVLDYNVSDVNPDRNIVIRGTHFNTISTDSLVIVIVSILVTLIAATIASCMLVKMIKTSKESKSNQPIITTTPLITNSYSENSSNSNYSNQSSDTKYSNSSSYDLNNGTSISISDGYTYKISK